MEWLKDTPIEKLIAVGVFILVVLVAIFFALKSLASNGLIESIKTQHGEIRLNAAKKETEFFTRDLIRRDIDSVERYLQCFCFEVENFRTKKGLVNDYGFKYVVQRMFLLSVKWIIFNQISKTDSYVKSKRHEMWNEFKSATAYQSMRSMKDGKHDIDYNTKDWQNRISTLTDGIITICVDNKMLALG